MAKYDKDTKFYWLQLKEDFFENDAIEWLEEQKPNGRDYAYFYLKLCLKSLKSNGVLIRQVGNILIPYDNNKLAELTKMDFDTVTVAMELLKKIGLIKILENGEIYVSQLENLIGSQSKGALKKQQQRLLGGQKVDKCPPKIEIELEKEIELELNNNIYDYISNNYNRVLSASEIEKIRLWLSEFNEEMIKKAVDISCLQNIKTFAYADGILKNWKGKGYKTIVDLQNEEKMYNNEPKKTKTGGFQL